MSIARVTRDSTSHRTAVGSSLSSQLSAPRSRLRRARHAVTLAPSAVTHLEQAGEARAEQRACRARLVRVRV
eukprot:CAMPEP_0118816068 /NCGR_PEP_ID=MMETSP1162-20130426/4555_1 /TAXON_ID=33656 /ORGANISM="Phaeocystis Sp, Strain CCMP2710" /LENGTH=71 /DNA_ID=CAMNT_0006746063 /DNA_START=163 /DNA_END=376 /DNA_ORIENTATION=+